MNIDNIGSEGIITPNYTTNKAVNLEAVKSHEVTQALGKDTFVKSTAKDALTSSYKPVKNKLSTEEVKALKDDEVKVKADFIRKFISDTINNQNKLLGRSAESGNNERSKATTDLLTKIFGSVEKAYPPIVTTPEGAKQAIGPGGAYSVNAVADRIMTMATAIAGNDPNKLQQMRAAVEKGFSQAGIDFKASVNSGLPQICKDTIAEVMKRFDELQNKTSTDK